MGIATAPPRRQAPSVDGIASPFAAEERIRAVLFDLDGTLYEQQPMRAMMAAELLTLVLRNPIAAPRRLRMLRAYRQSQEVLRRDRHENHRAADQIAMAAERAGVSHREAESLVNEWMQMRPLKHLRFCRARGLAPLLDFLASSGVRMGVLSDYPSAAKLRALGIEHQFSLVLCSTDPEIEAFKPHPRGFLVACGRWRLSAREVLMVGDRLDVDAAGAAAAGMPCVLIDKPRRSTSHPDLLVLESLERLHRVLDAGC